MASIRPMRENLSGPVIMITTSTAIPPTHGPRDTDASRPAISTANPSPRIFVLLNARPTNA